MSQVCCQESRSRRLWFDASDQFTEPDERQRVGKIEGKKEPRSEMYGCESWTIKKVERRRIDAF